MSEMVERVARALEGRWHQGAINSQELARAAIDAMRIPTEAMTSALTRTFSDESERHLKIGVALEGYRTMISAALSESVPATTEEK